MNYEIQCVISGASEVKYGASIHAVCSYLEGSQKSSSMVKTDKHFKKEETKRLREFIQINNLIV